MEEGKRIKVLVVDDHALVRRGIVDALRGQQDLLVVGEASNGQEALEQAQRLAPDVVIMDLKMPVMDGLEAIRRLQVVLPSAQILVLTVSEKEQDLFAALRFGARGYVLKDADVEELLRAVYHIAEGGVIVSPAMANKLLADLTQVPLAPEGLSPRELEVLRTLTQGRSNKEIARLLFISENTVKTHLRKIMDKLHLANRSQAAAYAARAGLNREEP